MLKSKEDRFLELYNYICDKVGDDILTEFLNLRGELAEYEQEQFLKDWHEAGKLN